MDRPLRVTVWPPLPLDVYASRRSEDLPYPLNGDHSLFSRARHGLWHGVKSLGLEPGDVVLAPAYHQGSEIEALVRAGLECRFYDVGPSLAPRTQELEELLDPRVRALYLIHYFGFPQDAPRWRKWCDERGLMLFEDAAMAWLGSWQGQPIGSFGNLAIFCLYKTFGVPDGGCVVGDRPLPSARGKADLGIVQATIHHGAWLAQKSAAVARLRSLSRSHGPQMSRLAPAPEGKFDLGDPDSPATRITTWLIPRIARQEAAAQRRRNYRFLLDAVGSVRPLFEVLPEGASPVGLPLVLEPGRQSNLLEALRRRGIAGSRFWQVPHPSLEVERFPGTRSLRSQCFMLPVHQEIPRASLEAMVEAMKEAATPRTTQTS